MTTPAAPPAGNQNARRDSQQSQTLDEWAIIYIRQMTASSMEIRLKTAHLRDKADQLFAEGLKCNARYADVMTAARRLGYENDYLLRQLDAGLKDGELGAWYGVRDEHKYFGQALNARVEELNEELKAKRAREARRRRDTVIKDTEMGRPNN